MAIDEAYPLYLVECYFVIGLSGILPRRIVQSVVDELHEEVFEEGGVHLADHRFCQGSPGGFGFDEMVPKEDGIFVMLNGYV